MAHLGLSTPGINPEHRASSKTGVSTAKWDSPKQKQKQDTTHRVVHCSFSIINQGKLHLQGQVKGDTYTLVLKNIFLVISYYHNPFTKIQRSI